VIDIVDKKTRSRMMSGIRGKNTKPEILVRKSLFSKGLRYRLHDKRLPGKPDLVFPKYKAVVFVNGCFWHGHDCYLFKWPSTRTGFWKKKITRNRELDRINIEKLKKAGWRVFLVWECALKGKGKRPLEQVINTLESWIRGKKTEGEIRGLIEHDRE